MPITNEVMKVNTQNLSAALTIRIGINPGTQSSCLISIKNKGVMLKTAKERTKRVPSKKGEVCSSRFIRIEYRLNFKNVYLKSNYDITSCLKSFHTFRSRFREREN
jgi:hypothetical protein